MQTALSTTELFLIAVGIIFTVPFLIWRVGKTDYYAPLVVVQIITGILLGPGILGKIFPDYYTFVLTPAVVQSLNGIAWWAVMIFVWIAGIELDLKKDEVRTPMGIASVRSSIARDAKGQAATGPWGGVQWKLEPKIDAGADLQTMSVTSIRFYLRRLDNGDGILYYNARKIESGVEVARVLTVLYYPLLSTNKST